MRVRNGKLTQKRAVRARAIGGAPPLPPVARQHLVQQNCSCCHNYEDYAGGDHSLLLFGSNMGESNRHLRYDTPAVLVGGASILGMLGVQAERFGDSTGPLQDI